MFDDLTKLTRLQIGWEIARVTNLLNEMKLNKSDEDFHILRSYLFELRDHHVERVRNHDV